MEATQRITLEELPPVLVLHIKCFVYDKNGGILKVTKQIEFEPTMDISKGKRNIRKNEHIRKKSVKD